MVILLLAVTALAACTAQQSQQPQPQASESEAVNVVKGYFEAWDDKNWPKMYSLISDGFKQIDQTAKTLQEFEAFAKKQGITAVRINSLTEKSNDGTFALVEYDVTFTVEGSSKQLKSTFSVKHKPNDQQPGWKLIHPFGPNIDRS